MALVLVGIVVLIYQSHVTRVEMRETFNDAVREAINSMATTLTTTFTCATGGMTMEHSVTTTQGNGEGYAVFADRHKSAVLAAKGSLCD